MQGVPKAGATSGAVTSIATSPADSAKVYITTVGGGVWKTLNINASTVQWMQLTDSYPSLATTTIMFGALSNQRLYVGPGNESSAADVGGPRIGILKSTDGGKTWTELGADVFKDMLIRSIVTLPTSDPVAAKEVVIAAGLLAHLLANPVADGCYAAHNSRDKRRLDRTKDAIQQARIAFRKDGRLARTRVARLVCVDAARAVARVEQAVGVLPGRGRFA